jgi:hypothetical protein
MSLSSNTNESAKHLEVTASHDVYIHETHVLPAAIKPLVSKHQLRGHILFSASHHLRAKPYIDLHRGDHHRE